MDSLIDISIRKLRDELEEYFGEDWIALEDETLSLELGIEFDDIMLGKVRFLKVMEEDPDRFHEDMLFFLHSCDIINNVSVEPDVTPMPGSLELAYALTEVEDLYPYEGVVSRDIRKTVTYLLNEEGYSTPIYPFDFIKPEELSPGQTPDDIAKKQRAISLYLAHMKDSHD